MSVEIILSHKQVILDDYNHSVLNLKATFAALPPNIYTLYKVRTNAKDMIDVRPSFGVLCNKQEEDTDNSVASMQIKYLGNPELLKKMKLQVSWVWGQGLPAKKLSHSQFSNLYNTLKQQIGKQQTHMLSFTTQEMLSKNQQETQPVQKTKPQEENDAQTLETLKQDEHHQTNKSSKVEVSRRFGCGWILLCILVAFMLGILVGMKAEKQLAYFADTSQKSMQEGILNDDEIVVAKSGQVMSQGKEQMQIEEVSQRQQGGMPSIQQELELQKEEQAL